MEFQVRDVKVIPLLPALRKINTQYSSPVILWQACLREISMAFPVPLQMGHRN